MSNTGNYHGAPELQEAANKLTEIKKALYKEKPEAKLFCVSQFGIFYDCYTSGKTHIQFKVPFADIGETMFFPVMPAQLLIRYIINHNITP